MTLTNWLCVSVGFLVGSLYGCIAMVFFWRRK